MYVSDDGLRRLWRDALSNRRVLRLHPVRGSDPCRPVVKAMTVLIKNRPGARGSEDLAKLIEVLRYREDVSKLEKLYKASKIDPKLTGILEGLLQSKLAEYPDLLRNGVTALPPPEKKFNGEIVIGNVTHGKRITSSSFALCKDELNKHVLVVGSTGTGKTNLLNCMMLQLHQAGIPFLCLSLKQDQRALMQLIGPLKIVESFRLKLNPVESPPGVDQQSWNQALADVYGTTQDIMMGGSDYFTEHLDYQLERFDIANGEYPSLLNVRDSIRAEIVKWSEARQRQDYKIRNEGRLNALLKAPGNIFDCSRGFRLEKLLNLPVVIELSGLGQAVHDFLVAYLLTWIYHYRLNQPERGKLKHIIIVDDAHRVFAAAFERSQTLRVAWIDRMVNEIRDLGEGFIVADQQPSLLASSIKSNAYCTIVLALGAAEEVQEMSGNMTATSEEKAQAIEAIQSRSPGEAVVRVGNLRAFTIRMPYLKLEREKTGPEEGQMTYRMLMAKDAFSFKPSLKPQEPATNEPVTEDKSQVSIVEKPQEQVPIQKTSDFEIPALSKNALCLLKDVFEFPFSNVTGRYGKDVGRLQMNTNSANRARLELENKQLISYETIALGAEGRNPKFLIPSQLAFGIAERQGFSTTMWARILRYSFRHAFWQHYAAEHFRKRGCEVKEEWMQEGGEHKPDVSISTSDNKRIAIEITCSLENVIENAKKCRELGYNSVVFYVEPQNVLKVEKMIDEAFPLKERLVTGFAVHSFDDLTCRHDSGGAHD
jgi:hypothetical protein